MSFTARLVAITSLPVAFISVIVFIQSSQLLLTSTQQSLLAVQKNKATAVTNYFSNIEKQVQTLANSELIVTSSAALNDYIHSFDTKNKTSYLDQKRELRKYYEQDFASEYSSKSENRSIDVSRMLDALSPLAISLQYRYIIQNEYPLGSKQQMNANLKDSSNYSKIHQRIHPQVRQYLEQFAYYDIFIADAKTGHIIYSVYKELDFGTSLLTGPYKDSGIAEVFRSAIQLQDSNNSVMADYSSYLPSYHEPASFIASPIVDHGKTIAVLIFQISIDKLNTIMNSRAGLGETGESYLVGSDFRLRSDSLQETGLLSKAFKGNSGYQTRSEFIVEGLEGHSAVNDGLNYNGTEVISAFAPINILGTRWALLAEITKSEALSGVYDLLLKIVASTVLIVLMAGVFGVKFGDRLSKQLSEPVKSLSQDTEDLSTASQSIKQETSRLKMGIAQSATAIEENMSAVSEILSTLESNLSKTDRILDMSQVLIEHLDTAEEQLNQLNQAFRQVDESSSKSQEIISLVDSIDNKTDLINNIVFKTQLLAVNASIEAAKAGEHGRGFSVVAEEVNKLSASSGDAADQINKLIVNSKGIIESLIHNNESIVSKSINQIDTFKKLFHQVSIDIKDILQDTEDIAFASKEQKNGLSQISSAIREIDQVARGNQKQVDNSLEVVMQIERVTGSLTKVKNLISSVTNKKEAA